MPVFFFGQSTIHYKCTQQDGVLPFGWKGCAFSGMSHISVKG